MKREHFVKVVEEALDSLPQEFRSRRVIAKEMGVGIGTARRAAQRLAKNLSGAISKDTLEALRV